MPASLPHPERRLLEDACPGTAPTEVLRTDTKVDVGRWWRPARLWVGRTGAELILVAAGPRACVERTPLTALHASRYNAVTGEVILAPAPGLQHRCLKLAPVEGHQLLAQIQ